MTYTLYGEPGSGSFCAEAAFAEAGVVIELFNLDLKKNEQLAPAYLAVNPTGKVPALKLPSGEIITESAAILLTIADRHTETGLLPKQGSAARASALRWIVFMSSEIYPMVEIVDYPQRFASGDDAIQNLKDTARTRLRARFLVLEKAITGPFILESGFGLADIYAANLGQFYVGHEWRREHCPKLEALTKKVAERPKIAPIWQRHFGSN